MPATLHVRDDDHGDVVLVDRDSRSLLRSVLELLEASPQNSPSEVVFRLQHTLGSDPDVNVERLMLLQHVVRSLNGTIEPSLPLLTNTPTPEDTPEPGIVPHLVANPAQPELVYAQGRFAFTTMWFKVKVIGSRKKEPSIRVKYIARMNGDTHIACLPSPQKDYVYATQTTVPELG